MHKLTGYEAIDYAEHNAGVPLRKDADPIEGANDALTPDQARVVCERNPLLVYCFTGRDEHELIDPEVALRRERIAAAKREGQEARAEDLEAESLYEKELAEKKTAKEKVDSLTPERKAATDKAAQKAKDEEAARVKKATETAAERAEVSERAKTTADKAAEKESKKGWR